MHADQITIAIPAFNEENHIEAAITSALAQDATVLVCDNASTDATLAICADYLRRYSNLRYIKHKENIGALANFKWALTAATTPYFMWLGAHDVLPREYASTLCASLVRNWEAVMAFGNVQYIDSMGANTQRYEYEFASKLQSKQAHTRLLAIAQYLNDCTLIHGLFRRQSLLDSWFDEAFLGFDHALLASVALRGPFLHVPFVSYMRRVVRDDEKNIDKLRRINPTATLNVSENIYERMIPLELSLFRSLSDVSRVRRKVYMTMAWYYYLKRFGPWGRKGSIQWTLNVTIWFSIRALSYSRKMLGAIFSLRSSRT